MPYKIGDIVKVISRENGHVLEVGSVHTIKRIDSHGQGRKWYSLRPPDRHGDSGYWVLAYEIEYAKTNSIKFKKKRVVTCDQLSTNN